MKRAQMLLVALLWVVPAGAFAHGPGEHPADPNLHVDDSFEECFVQFAPNLTQDAFRRFAREFGSISAFKPTSAPQTLGRRRVALTVQQQSFTVEEKAAAWNDTFAHPDAYHELGADKDFPQMTLRVGVTDRVDLGAYYTENPWANYGWIGVDAKYGVLRQDESMPVSLSVRGAYTRTLYVADMDMDTFSADVAAGRTFWNSLTPYLYLGADLVHVSETSGVVDLQDETQIVPRLTGGLEYRFWHLGLGAEYHLADVDSYQVLVTGRF